MKLDEKFESEEKLVDIIRKIVGLAGREVSEANPIVDTRLPDGSRVNVVSGSAYRRWRLWFIYWHSSF